MPSLPVRGFGLDGLLVTGGVGATEVSDSQVVVGSGTQFGLLGLQAGAAVVLEAGTYAGLPGAGPVAYRSHDVSARGRQTGLIGAQRGASVVRPGAAYLAAIFDLDADLYAAALKEAA